MQGFSFKISLIIWSPSTSGKTELVALEWHYDSLQNMAKIGISSAFPSRPSSKKNDFCNLNFQRSGPWPILS